MEHIASWVVSTCLLQNPSVRYLDPNTPQPEWGWVLTNWWPRQPIWEPSQHISPAQQHEKDWEKMHVTATGSTRRSERLHLSSRRQPQSKQSRRLIVAKISTLAPLACGVGAFPTPRTVCAVFLSCSVLDRPCIYYDSTKPTLSRITNLFSRRCSFAILQVIFFVFGRLCSLQQNSSENN